MADRVSLAIRQEQAINRLEAGIAALAGKSGLELPVIPRRGNDPEMLRALQLEAIAESIDTVTENIQVAEVETGEEVAEVTEAYEGWTKADLVLELNARKIGLETVAGTGTNGNVLVEDIRAALVADDAKAKG